MLSLNDLRLALELADEYGVPMQLVSLAAAETEDAVKQGLGQKDSSATMLLQERRAGVELRVSQDGDG